MQAQKKNQILEKSRKKIYAFTLSEDNILKLENKIGYNSRSKIVNELISNFVKRGKGFEKSTNPKTTRLETKRFTNV